MKKTALKIFAFIILLIVMIVINMMVFRSESPLFWIITFIISVLILILLPYKSFFNQSNEE